MVYRGWAPPAKIPAFGAQALYVVPKNLITTTYCGCQGEKKKLRNVLKAQPQSTKAKTVDVMRGRVRGA
jgi:hypothetical protein